MALNLVANWSSREKQEKKRKEDRRDKTRSGKGRKNGYKCITIYGITPSQVYVNDKFRIASDCIILTAKPAQH